MSRTLYVNNLPLSATEDHLVTRFARFGVVVSVKINRDPSTGRSQRSGFVEMKSGAEAQNAVKWLNFSDFDGRLMSVSTALARAPESH